jgi:glutathione S-transferase
MNATMPALSLQVRRHIQASRARVFDAWTKPELIMKWFAGPACQLTAAKNDLRVGGEYAFTLRKADSGDSVLKGIYREITPPARLVFTWNGCTDTAQKDATLVTVELTEKNGGTEVCITHENFQSAESCEQHQQGWTCLLENMDKVFGGKA